MRRFLKNISALMTGTLQLNANAGSVPKPWIARLEALLAPLDNLPNGTGRPGLARDLADYVLTAEPRAVLHDIAQTAAAAEHLGLLDYSPELPKDFYASFAAVPPAVGLRWARML